MISISQYGPFYFILPLPLSNMEINQTADIDTLPHSVRKYLILLLMFTPRGILKPNIKVKDAYPGNIPL